MEYVVHIENCVYFQWQAYLLVESFRRLGLEDQLVVAYSNTNDTPLLFDFSRLYPVEHVGAQLNCPCVSKFFSAYAALKAGVVKQPFVLIDPDMLLLKPVVPTLAPAAANYFSYMERPSLELIERFNLPTKEWYPVGVVYQFANVSEKHMEDILSCCYYVANKYKPGDGKLSPGAYWFRDMVGVALGLSRSGLECEIVDNYQSSLDHRQPDFVLDANFVHYCKGYPPYFHKAFYDDRNDLMKGNVPFDDILAIPVHQNNPHVKVLKQVVASFVDEKRGYFTS